LDSVKFIKSKFIVASHSDCLWRRLAVHEQQSEREKKNILQKVLIFKSRATEIMAKD